MAKHNTATVTAATAAPEVVPVEETVDRSVHPHVTGEPFMVDLTDVSTDVGDNVEEIVEEPIAAPTNTNTNTNKGVQVQVAERPAMIPPTVEIVTLVKAPGIDMTKYNHLPTKSAKIRAMKADGYTTSQIAKSLGILYQHARNVLNQLPPKRAAVG